MINSEQENCNRCRRRLGLTHGLAVLCLVVFANLSGAQNYNSQFNYNFNIYPYPLSKTLNGSIQEKNVTVEKILDDKKNYCFKPECIHTASRILSFMDESLDPCDNFYEFACGQYMREHEKSDEMYKNNNFASIRDEVRQKMKNILEQDLKPTEPKYVKLMKTFYRNCKNSTSDAKEFQTKMAVNIVTKINGWSYLNNSRPMKNDNFRWEKYQAKIIKATNFLQTSFFQAKLMRDMKNNSNFVLRVQQPSGLTNSNFSSIEYFLPELKKHNVPFEDLIVKIHKIEKMLINISIPEDDRQIHIFDRMTVKELEGNYSNILWREIFNGILQPTTEIRDDDIVLLSDSSFFKKLNENITNISKTDQSIYVIWTLVKDILNEDVLKNTENNKQWENCIDLTRDSFMGAFGALYVKNYVNEETSNKHIEEIITNIFHQFNIIIKNADWLDQKTNDYALEKLSLLYAERQKIFEISDDKEYDKFFTNLEISEGDFYVTIMNITKFAHELVTPLYGAPLNRFSMFDRADASIVNAYNAITLNSFGISPGFLQGVLFNESRPMYMNYGAMGTIAGHEFTHGFDSLGKHFDKLGNLNVWWEPTSEKQFAEKAQCFISQYNNYKDKEVNLNVSGIRTLGENIADNAGLKISYLAYQKWVKDHGSEPLLPGLNYTQSQLFWISFAQAFCHKGSPKYQKMLLESDEHSPAEFRIIGSLSNRPEFAKDFQCSVGSKMNSAAKCSLW